MENRLKNSPAGINTLLKKKTFYYQTINKSPTVHVTTKNSYREQIEVNKGTIWPIMPDP